MPRQTLRCWVHLVMQVAALLFGAALLATFAVGQGAPISAAEFLREWAVLLAFMVFWLGIAILAVRSRVVLTDDHAELITFRRRRIAWSDIDEVNIVQRQITWWVEVTARGRTHRVFGLSCPWPSLNFREQWSLRPPTRRYQELPRHAPAPLRKPYLLLRDEWRRRTG